MSLGRAVGIATEYGLDDRIVSSSSTGKEFSLLNIVQAGSGLTQSPN
jgi:hypothetical protein